MSVLGTGSDDCQRKRCNIGQYDWFSEETKMLSVKRTIVMSLVGIVTACGGGGGGESQPPVVAFDRKQYLFVMFHQDRSSIV